jgi:hypothetical protein
MGMGARTEAAAFFWALARSLSRWLPRVIMAYIKSVGREWARNRETEKKFGGVRLGSRHRIVSLILACPN